MMWPETQRLAVDRLTNDYRLKASTNGQWLQGGICPNCEKKELYANAENPWRILCGRINHCGYSADLQQSHRQQHPRICSTDAALAQASPPANTAKKATTTPAKATPLPPFALPWPMGGGSVYLIIMAICPKHV